MTDDERALILSLADRVRRIRAHSRTRPHVFLEDKSEIAAALAAMAKREKPVKPKPDVGAAFGSVLRRTVTAARGHEVVVERRARA